ncbi:MAG: glycosyltransferase family 2 protein [Candidatus Omnitrophica bacterium]|nr:glycosyltransferase family 2 protein [Candidatus Omnitrophota bacterium]
MTLSAVVITLNEEENIESCLESVRWADEIVVVDGGSRDETMALARKYTDKVFRIPFKDFSTQKNEAIRKASGDWILILDADERVTPRLKSEISEIVQQDKEECVYGIKRQTFFFGKRLGFSGTQDDYPIRLFPRGKAHYAQPVHEELVTKLDVEYLHQTIVHFSTQDRKHYQEKLDRYIPLELKVIQNRGQSVRRMDPYLRASGKFLFLYIWKSGWRDGWAGFQYARLSAYYVFLKYQRFLKAFGRGGS